MPGKLPLTEPAKTELSNPSFMSVAALPIPFTRRNCVKCLQDFSQFNYARVCPKCRYKTPPKPLTIKSRQLMPRENQIVGLVAQGLLNKEIAYQLHLTTGTIKVYIDRIFKLTGVRNRTELAIKSLTGTLYETSST